MLSVVIGIFYRYAAKVKKICFSGSKGSFAITGHPTADDGLAAKEE